MARLLILLTLPPDVTEQYRQRFGGAFPDLEIEVVAEAGKAAPAIGSADALLTFGQMMKNMKLDLAGADRLKWVQALGTGLDGITDQPALKASVTITSLHGVHGAAGVGGRARRHAGAGPRYPAVRAPAGAQALGPLAGQTAARTRPSASSASA